ncbi:co-chaperone GroES [candidate division WWE3 bacterium CG_4_9_14_0_2_um_filter_35_11]|uniref:Co-chaperonin GroES n=1 Tax=candidate division WWE3 bacterium CG_4_9_14_0_2_um_filter_35_11 TaxID=1975077 RepID=A0A2M8EL37_UNCKA|nr:MAG: co-chaperone GroES [candidate division WWE3 bacterium CG10_big_fil_rev_8_21_14_0_10_35_32]PJC23456.1 MAG: co-chaperone GroES [candidate division WWE3 bacterium CG_4_9_14_0_2_um_filter_35_11]
MTIKPLSDKVVLKLLDPKEKTSGGIFLPDDSQEETHMAEVIAVGEGRFSESGQLIKPEVKKGQTVLIKGKWAGENVMVDGVEYKIVNDSDILAVIE